jgi:hypothetical protein
MKKYFERMRGHEKFTTSLEISSGPPPGINNDCSLRQTYFMSDRREEMLLIILIL